jgi:(p)ppGpp synthase/HD superfamily hydrolase
LFASPLPSNELYRDGFEPNRESATGDQRQDGIEVAERLPQTRAAVAFATRMHAGQRRADGTPFILHPLEVATRLYVAGAPDHLIAAAAMHDLIEKTDISALDLRQRFGPRIAEPVLAVSDDERIAGYTKRKAALRRQV